MIQRQTDTDIKDASQNQAHCKTENVIGLREW